MSLSFFLRDEMFLSRIFISLSRSVFLRLCAMVLAVSGILSNSMFSFFFSICRLRRLFSMFLITVCSCSNFSCDSSLGLPCLSLTSPTGGFLKRESDNRKATNRRIGLVNLPLGWLFLARPSCASRRRLEFLRFFDFNRLSLRFWLSWSPLILFLLITPC